MTDVTALPGRGVPCWAGLLVRSLPAAREFYGALFGWEFVPGPAHFGPYVRAVLDGRLVAGIGESPRRLGQPVAWTTYLGTADADAAAEAVRGCGGTIAVGPLDAEDEAGRMLIAADPSGASFGVWQPRGHGGTEANGVPGSVHWHELVTRRPETAEFYAGVFGLRAGAPEPAGDGPQAAEREVTLYREERAVASVRAVGEELPPGRGARWTTWFAVADTDAAVRRAGALGARVLAGPRRTGRGRVAELADPQGASFSVTDTAG